MNRSQLNQEAVIYQDDDLFVMNKPCGIPVHGSRILAGQPQTLLQMTRQYLGKMAFVVHRLDRPVSGVIALTLNQKAQADLGRDFEHRQVQKCYLAVVRGWTENSGLISHPLQSPRDERTSRSVAKAAVTRFQQISRVEIPLPVHPYPSSRYSLLALYPQTGRRHQLRRHMKHISHHIIGDTSYGRGEHNRFFQDNFNCSRLLLHAWTLDLKHPASGNKHRFHATLDPAFESLIRVFGWADALEAWMSKHQQCSPAHFSGQ